MALGNLAQGPYDVGGVYSRPRLDLTAGASAQIIYMDLLIGRTCHHCGLVQSQDTPDARVVAGQAQLGLPLSHTPDDGLLVPAA